MSAPRPLPRLELRDLGLRYGPRQALEDVDLRLMPGERAAILGPNGAGKSSLLRCVTGLVPPSAGAIELDGRALASYDRQALARRIAVVPQLAALPFAMRVEEVVALGRIPHEDPFRGPRATDRAAVAAAVRRVGIEDLVGRDARELSLGERQLVLVAMALAQGAPLLVLDEPTVHLDLRHRVRVMELLADLNAREGVTVLAVLHDLALAAHFFPRLVMLHRGRVVADGDPASVLAPHRVEAVYGVDPAIAALAGI